MRGTACVVSWLVAAGCVRGDGEASPPTFVYNDLTLDAGGWVTGVALHKATGRVMARTDVGGVYALQQQGLPGNWSWRWVSGSLTQPGTWNVQGLVADPADAAGNTWLMAVGAPGDNTTKHSWLGSGVYRTTDFGATWDRVLQGADVTFNGNGDARHGGEVLHFDTMQRGTVYAAACSGLFVSHTFGKDAWTKLNVPRTIYNSSSSECLAGVATSRPVGGTGLLQGTLQKRNSSNLWLYGPTTLALSPGGEDRSTWIPLQLSGNSSSLRIVGGHRTVSARNGTTLFITAVLEEASTSIADGNAALDPAADLPPGLIEAARATATGPTASPTSHFLSHNLVADYHSASRRSRRARLPQEADNRPFAGSKSGQPGVLLLKLTLSMDATKPGGLKFAWTQLSGRSDGLGLCSGSGGNELVQLAQDETVLISAFADGSFGVSRDGGWHFAQRNRTLRPEGAPGWWPSLDIRNTLPYGNGELVEVVVPPTNAADAPVTGWLMGTGFFPALTTDEGNTFTAITKGMGEVCSYQPVSQRVARSRKLTPFSVTGGVMDLSMFAWKSEQSAVAGAFDYAFFAHQPGHQFWVTDYCHTTITVANGDMVSFCNHQGWGCGQLLRSKDQGRTWNLTDSAKVVGIGNCVPFVDVAQNPNNLDDIVVTGAFGWMPDPAKFPSNATFWAGGIRRTLDGGKTFLPVTNASCVVGFVGSYWSPENNLVRDPLAPQNVYLLTDASGISVSRDGGNTWARCPSPFGGGFNGVLSVWDGYNVSRFTTGKTSPGKSPLLVLGGNVMDGRSLQVSYDGCQSWEPLFNRSLFSWEYPAPGPVLDAFGDSVVVYAAAGPDLGVMPTGLFSFFATVNSGRSWVDISPGNLKDTTGSLPGPRYTSNPTGALVDRENPNVFWLATGGRSLATVSVTMPENEGQ